MGCRPCKTRRRLCSSVVAVVGKAVATGKILVVRQVLFAVLLSAFVGKILFGVLFAIVVRQILLAVLFSVGIGCGLLLRNASHVTDYFRLPSEQVVEIGRQISI
jgi:hypothetical protein